MPETYDSLLAVYNETQKEVTRSPEDWQNFLRTACRNYRLRFDEQLLLYAQKPDAEAVLEYGRWQRLFGRNVNKGAAGIAVFDAQRPGNLKYYFDVSDTHASRYSKPVPVWQYDDSFEGKVTEALTGIYGGLKDTRDTERTVFSASNKAVGNIINDTAENLVRNTGDSFFDGLDGGYVSVTLKTVLQNSVSFMTLSRLGFDPYEYFDREDFEGIVNFNTPDTLNILGTALGGITRKMLGGISQIPGLPQNEKYTNRIIADYEKGIYTEYGPEKERGVSNEKDNIQDGRGRPDPEPHTDREGTGTQHLRQGETVLPYGGAWGGLLQHADQRNPVGSSGGHPDQGERDGRETRQGDDGEGRPDGAAQGGRHDEMGPRGEQHQGERERNRDERTDIHTVNDLPPLTDRSIIRGIIQSTNGDEEKKETDIGGVKAGSEKTEDGLLMYEGEGPEHTRESVFSYDLVSEIRGAPQASLFAGTGISDEVIDTALSLGTHDPDSRYAVTSYFKKNKPLEDNASFLKELYSPFAAGFILNNERYSVLARENGLVIARGDTARDNPDAKELGWAQTAVRIREMLDGGRYAPKEIIEGADENGRNTIAGRMVYMLRDVNEGQDLPDDVRSLVRLAKIGPFNDAVHDLAGRLGDKEQLEGVIKGTEEYRDAFKRDQNISRFPTLHDPDSILESLKNLQLPQLNFPFAVEFIEPERFISDDEIDNMLRDYQPFENGHGYIWSLYTGTKDRQERENKLREHYGTSGLYNRSENIDVSSAGIRLSHGDITAPYADRTVRWNEVEKRLGNMIRDGRFSPDDRYPAWEEEEVEDDKQTRQTRYEYHPGDEVYMGTKRYEVLSVTDDTVLLYDDEAPLFNREMPRDEFEARLNESPLNDGLKTAENGNNNIGSNGTRYSYHLGDRVIYPDPEEKAAPVPQENPPNEEIPKAETVETTEETPAHSEVIRVENTVKTDFNLRDSPVEEVGKKERYRRNIEAIRVLKQCGDEGRNAVPDEQLTLSKYVGWGGIPEAFDENNPSWSNEYAELKSLLNDNEYASAKESTLTAFFTPPDVTDSIYAALERLGFKGGNILEPSCGTGNFIGMLPASMKGSRIYGVELDEISAGIASQLYQTADIFQGGFEDADMPDSFFDLVLGNVPFGDIKVHDNRYDKYNFLIHDYFFAKGLDKLRPGGIMALVTSKGTMDKENESVRRYISQRADLLGAVRLPNDTFKGNAGTEIVSDILILQKRDRLLDTEPEWVHLKTGENGFRMNAYFVNNPEMVLGDIQNITGRFGEEMSVLPREGAELSKLLKEAVSNIRGEYIPFEPDEEQAEDDTIPADKSVRNFSYTVIDGDVYFRENSIMRPVRTSETALNRIKGMVQIRDCARNLLDIQADNAPDGEIKTAQEKLNTLYDDFTKRYGNICSRANVQAFSDDSSFPLLSALEVLDDEGNVERKADIFTKRTVKPHVPVTEVDTAAEALAVSIGEKGKIDMEYMSSLSGKTEDEMLGELRGVIFKNPLWDTERDEGDKYLTADGYLSGNVREKLKTARKAVEDDPSFGTNVQALEKVQPEDLQAGDIFVRLGSTWVPPETVRQFIFELFDTPYYLRRGIRVHYSEYTGEWNVEGKAADRTNFKASSVYGTERINGYKITEETLNLKDVRIFDYEIDEDGKKRPVLNSKETAIAQAKQEQIKESFKDWVWKDPMRRQQLVTIYNEKFNSVRPREYDGRHITFAGMNPEIELRPHQRNAVARVLYGGNTLLAHAVGAGKTYEMAAAAMESKRLGLCTKSLFVVPNHLTEQWASEFLQLYPGANILVATKKDFETKNRKKFCARIATGDYDAVIIGHSQFEKIPVSIERQRKSLEDELDEITDGINEMRKYRGESFSVKQLQKSRKSVEVKLKKLNDQSKKDDTVTFEELGIDRLFIDESHYYKNLYLYTKMRNVGGIAQTEAQKSSDLFMKCRYLDELTGNRGVVFATGTPISNSMTELYTIQRYLQYDTLVKNKLQHFDAWAATFGETVTALELKPEGTGYRTRTRFSKFYNLPELMAMFRETADIQTADMLNLPVPKANYHNVAVKASDMQKEMVAGLADRAEKVRAGNVNPSADNMLKITNDGRKLALDQRMMNPALPDFEGSKVNACVDNTYKIWNETKENRSAQLIFCDLSTPKGNGEFSVYTDIKGKLVERGVPEEEVRFIHEADTESKKQELFKKVRSGDVRVLIGSTQKMGTGTNCQERLIAMHDLDCPWRPADLEQRSGRIIRQGNNNPEVDIYRYVTEGTFDAYLYQLIEGKQKFASQIMTSKSPVRSADDIDETALSYAEIKMLATGNPMIKEKMDLDTQVQKLKLLKSNFLSERYALEDRILKEYPSEISDLETKVSSLEHDAGTALQHPKGKNGYPGMEIKGTFYDEKADAGEALLDACKEIKDASFVPIGHYRGFELQLGFDTSERSFIANIRGEASHPVLLGDDLYGNLTRIDNTVEKLGGNLEVMKNKLEETEKQFENAKEEVKKPFEREEELNRKSKRLNELNIELNLDRTENEMADDVPDEEEAQSVRRARTYAR